MCTYRCTAAAYLPCVSKIPPTGYFHPPACEKIPPIGVFSRTTPTGYAGKNTPYGVFLRKKYPLWGSSIRKKYPLLGYFHAGRALRAKKKYPLWRSFFSSTKRWRWYLMLLLCYLLMHQQCSCIYFVLQTHSSCVILGAGD